MGFQEETTEAQVLEAARQIEHTPSDEVPLGGYSGLWACVKELVQVSMFRFGLGLNRLLFKKCNLKYNSWLILGSDLWLSGYKITIVASSSV